MRPHTSDRRGDGLAAFAQRQQALQPVGLDSGAAPDGSHTRQADAVVIRLIRLGHQPDEFGRAARVDPQARLMMMTLIGWAGGLWPYGAAGTGGFY